MSCLIFLFVFPIRLCPVLAYQMAFHFLRWTVYSPRIKPTWAKLTAGQQEQVCGAIFLRESTFALVLWCCWIRKRPFHDNSGELPKETQHSC